MVSTDEVQQLLRQLKGEPADPKMKARLMEIYRRWLAEIKLRNKLRSTPRAGQACRRESAAHER